MMLKKPLKITIDNPLKDVPLDYEMAGKILDNMLVMAEEQGVDIEDEKLDKLLTFSIGKINEYKARLRRTKTMYIFDITYLREIPKKEIKRVNGLLPKDKKLAHELDEARKKAEAEKKKKEKAKKVIDEKKK